MPLKNIVLGEPVILIVKMEGGSPFYSGRRKKSISRFTDSFATGKF